MELFEALSAQPGGVERIDLQRILAAANTAPSAGNLQAYRIVVVQHAATRSSSAAAAHGQGFLALAPVALAFFSDPARSATRYRARGERGAFDDKRVAQVLGAPAQLRPMCLLAIGYAAKRPAYSSRRDLVDLVHEETFKAA